MAHACLKHSRKEMKESLLLRDVPSGPWEIVGTDLFDLDGSTYILVSDYYSKMPFVRRLRAETSGAVIGKLKTIFSEHGILSDGGESTPLVLSSNFMDYLFNKMGTFQCG